MMLLVMIPFLFLFLIIIWIVMYDNDHQAPNGLFLGKMNQVWLTEVCPCSTCILIDSEWVLGQWSPNYLL